MNVEQLQTRVEAIIKRMDTLMRAISTAREEEAQAKIVFERQQEAHLVVGRDLMMEYAAQPEFAELTRDPRTGKHNKEWTGWVMDQALGKNEEYQEALTEFYDAQVDLQEKGVKLVDLHDQIGVVKSQARLMGSLITLATEDWDGG